MCAVPDDHVVVRSNALAALAPWAGFAERYWWRSGVTPGLGCFGTGYDSWGVQTNQKYLAACAVMATDPDLPREACALSRDELVGRALAALRYSLATHKSGYVRRTDGTQWGRTWISGLGVERMVHGVEAIDEHLTDEDRAALRRMLVSEAEAQFEAEVEAERWQSTRKNKPESNIWNGAILARAALLYPDDPRADAWREKAGLFLMNGISVPADAEDDGLVDGRPVREWHVGANFFPHYALDHHSYLNVGYMVICLSNVAMLHYAFRARDQQPPEALYHHARDLWGLVKRLIAPNGRLLRIGGDTRQRYCYCQDYLIPTLVWAADHLGDPHALALARGAIETVRAEQGAGADGSFVGSRLAHIARTNPYYYTRLESDKAVVLSMAAEWIRRFGIESPAADEPFEPSVQGGWEEAEHGAAFHRSPTRLASWSWRAAERPQGLCLPPDCPHVAEWEECLAGKVKLAGAAGRREVQWQWVRSLDGGFLTMGRVNEGAEVHLPEGWRRSNLLDHCIVFAALPDEHTVVRLELAGIGPMRVYLAALEGVSYRVANDLFNGFERTYHGESGEYRVVGEPDHAERLDLRSDWVNVEDRVGLIGLYGGESWWLAREEGRSGGYAGSIYSDRLCWPGRWGQWDVEGPAALLDTGCIVISSIDARATRALRQGGAARRTTCSEDDVRAVVVPGQDGARYLLAANFSSSVAGGSVELGQAATLVDLCGGEASTVSDDGLAALHVAPQSAALYRLASD